MSEHLRCRGCDFKPANMRTMADRDISAIYLASACAAQIHALETEMHRRSPFLASEWTAIQSRWAKDVEFWC